MTDHCNVGHYCPYGKNADWCPDHRPIKPAGDKDGSVPK